MSVRNLDRFFQPRSVAVVGASERQGSVGATAWNKLAVGRHACRRVEHGSPGALVEAAHRGDGLGSALGGGQGWPCFTVLDMHERGARGSRAVLVYQRPARGNRARAGEGGVQAPVGRFHRIGAQLPAGAQGAHQP